MNTKVDVQCLDRVEDYLAGREDVVDGDYGVPDPNEEMTLLRDVREAQAALAALTALARAFIDNIDEWDGEPTPGMRWHKEYLTARALLPRAKAPEETK